MPTEVKQVAAALLWKSSPGACPLRRPLQARQPPRSPSKIKDTWTFELYNLAWEKESHMTAVNSDKTILLTGAGGWIGSALAKAIAASSPRFLILLDHSERNLHQVCTELAAVANSASHTAILGDVSDRALLAEIFETHRPQIIYHAAAFKHVPLMEMNPIAAVRNNAVGTARLARAACEQEAEKFVMISTDKAVNPRSVMGASKRVAELALERCRGAHCEMKAVRLGNVLGAYGSVVPLFLDQIARGGPVTVADPEVSRYFLTLNEAVELILGAAELTDGDGILVPELGEPIKIIELARQLILRAGRKPEIEIPLSITGLRPGDKMTEELASASETLKPTADARLSRVSGSSISPAEFDMAVAKLAEDVGARDINSLLKTLCRLVPEYEPSETVLQQLRRARAAGI
jgi:FlaA1/EpsC-like NDP-sugar epimerase